MKLKLRNRSNGHSHNIPRTRHGDTLRELVSVQRKLDSLQAFPACKLSADALVTEVLAIDPHASRKGAVKLRASLEKHPPSLTHSNIVLRRMIAGLRGSESNWKSSPAKFPNRLDSFGGSESPECKAELTRYGSSIFELYATAIEITNERFPGTFGTATSSAELKAEEDELKARRDELFKRADSEVNGDDDLIWSDDPKVPASFKASGGKVPYAPKADANQRLVNFLMAQRGEQSH